MENIFNLTFINFDKYYLTPKYIIKDKNRIIGYISPYKNNTQHINYNNLSRNTKIKILEKAKDSIIKLHNKYKLIHGDLNTNNILYDDEFNTYLLDFDATLKFGQKPDSLISFSGLTTNYINYFKYDYKADIFRFNITTLKILNDIGSDIDIIEFIKHNANEFSKETKILTKELLLEPENIKKEYSGEFIIDYIK